MLSIPSDDTFEVHESHIFSSFTYVQKPSKKILILNYFRLQLQQPVQSVTYGTLTNNIGNLNSL